MREAVSAIMRREQNLAGELYPYYQDVYDHVLRIGESSDALRDLGATIVETNLALRDFRQNQVVKRVGSWAAIIAVPTLITGYYGMNVPYPGSGTTAGVVVSAALALGLPTGLYLYFRHRDWL
jgi:magnesium transporter